MRAIRFWSVCLLFWATYSAQAAETSRVLIIHSTVDVSPWVYKFNNALFGKLRTETQVHIGTESFAFSDYSEQELSRFGQIIFEKHQDHPPDLIIAVLPEANDFVRNHLPGFAQIKKLYVLPSPEFESETSTKDHVISSAWHVAVEKTIVVMHTLMPDLENVYLLSGSTQGNDSYLRRSQRALEPYSGFNFIDIVGASAQEMLESLNSAPPNSAAMLLTYDSDRFGNKFTNPQIMAELHAAEVPIFTMLETVLEQGVVGGNITNATLYGEVTASEALQIMGKSQFDRSSNLATKYYFDMERLEYFNLDPDRLPPGSILLNEDQGIWQQYWLEIVAAITLLSVQFLMIFGLVILTRQQRINEREQTNQRRRFEAVINGIPDAIVVTNAKGTIVALNHPGFELTFGYPQDQKLGSSVDSLFASPLSREEAVNVQTHCQTQDAKRFPSEVTIKTITDIDGVTSGRFYVIRDISERLVNEEELRQAQKMEAIGNLAGGIAHDFNNILMAIIGNAEIAQDSTTKPQARHQSLDSILAAGQRASELIAEIMQFSRRDTEGMSHLDLKQLLEESETLIRASFQGLSISFDLDPDLPTIHGNGTQLQRVLLNLCSNAAYALDGRGKIMLKAKQQQLPVDAQLNNCQVPAGNYVQLSISDDGPGIDPEILPRIFEPFFTTKGQGQGTGIGLATVYKTIESHQGYIDLASDSSGTTFTIYLPISYDAAAQKRENQMPKIELDIGVGKKVLLVDDDEMVLQTSAACLNKLNFEVEQYSNPLTALEVCQTRGSQFDLVITDYAMPELNGLELIERLPEEFNGKVLICTGNRNVDETLQNSNNSILNKPYTTADLSNAIQTLLSA